MNSLLLALIASRLVGAPSGMATVPAGSYLPLYAAAGQRVSVARFAIDREPVTREEYLRFVRSNPAWQRSAVKRAFAEEGYLADWRGDLDAGAGADLRAPVVGVSWFAARAFCAVQGKRLPTTDEWEYVAAANETTRNAARDPAFIARVTQLYTTRSAIGPRKVGTAPRNIYGVGDMHELVWEWTLDFNGTLPSDGIEKNSSSHEHGHAHADSKVRGHTHDTGCASAAIGASDPTNYPAFLRSAVRSALTERSTTSGLGFRCAADIPV